MRRLILCGALVLAGCHRHRGGGRHAGGGGPVSLRTDEDKTLYALGVVMGQRLGDFNLSPSELSLVEGGLRDQVTGAHRQVDLAQYGPRIGEMARTRQAARGEREHQRGVAFAAAAAQEPGAVHTPSGLVYREIRPGTGPQPSAADQVTVNYRGTLIDGTEFDSSYARNEPAHFSLGGVIPCWTEGVARMHVGGKARLVCPSAIAYGEHGQRDIPPGATLVFEIELLGIGASPAPPGAPPVLGAPPAPGMAPGMAPGAAHHP